jgi:hypothetical protein
MDTTEQAWTWRIINTETGEARRFYRDGAALAAIGKPHPKTFWDRHPLVDRVENRWVGPGDEVEVKIWTTGEATPDAPETARPGRPADLQFSGGWRSDPDFWAAHPDAEHVEFYQSVDVDEPDGDTWTVAIWLKA